MQLSINHSFSMYENFNPHEIKIAQTIAHALEDYDSMPYHLQNARKYNEVFLEKQLETVLAIPLHRIKNSRAAYYVFLISHNASKDDFRH